MMQSTSKIFMMAIAGGSGSGKTTIARKVEAKCPGIDILVVNQDHYYKDLSHLSAPERDAVNFDHPESFDNNLLFEHLSTLSQGRKIMRPTYDYKDHVRTKEVVELTPKAVVLFDGILSLHDPRCRALYNLSVFVDVPDDVRFIRRLKRDVSERGRTMDGVITQYLQSVKPMYDLYVAPGRHTADFVVNWERYDEHKIDMIANMVCQAVVKS